LLTTGFFVTTGFLGVTLFLKTGAFVGVVAFFAVALGVGLAVAAKDVGTLRHCSAIRAIATLRTFTAETT